LIRYKRLGISLGNIKALAFLGLLGAVSALLVVAIILVPLVRSGLPEMDRWGFAQAVSYFALIGLGFMLVQISYMQRFSIYLGHPANAIAVILFSMILFTGVGSCVSDRLPIEAQPGWLFAVPLATAAMILGVSLAIQPIIDTTIYLGLSIRCAVVVALVAPVALLLGLCFPIGMRLVERLRRGHGLGLEHQRGLRRPGLGGGRRPFNLHRDPCEPVSCRGALRSVTCAGASAAAQGG
jgi:hypothetical protein